MKIDRAWLVGSLLSSLVACGGGQPLSVTAPTPTPTAMPDGATASSTAGAGGQPAPTPLSPPPPPAMDASAPPPIVTFDAGAIVDAPVTPPPPVPLDAGPPTPTTGSGCLPLSTSPTQADGTCVRSAFKHNGVCVCQPSTPVVCGNACTDLLSDDDNCGCCGNKCPTTSACNLGKCGPVPTIVSSSPASVCRGLELALEGPTLYWANVGDGKIQRAPATGGPALTLALGELEPHGILVRAGNIFWMSGTPGVAATSASIRITSTNGGGVAVVGSAPAGYGGFTVAPDGVTIYTSSGNGISKQFKAGAPVVVGVEAGGGVPRALALDGTRLAFPTDINGDVDVISLVDGQVASCGMPSATAPDGYTSFNCERIARSQGSLGLTSIFIEGSFVVWSDGANIKMDSLLSGVQANFAVVSADANIRGMATLPKGLVFSSYDDADPTTGIVGQAPLVENATTTRLARNQLGPGSIVTDGVRAYWSTSDCRIFSTPVR